jgi:hypothetical protein
MPDVQAKVKLTTNQQEVVNLMAAGYTLRYTRGMGRFSNPSARLRSGDDWRKIPANVPELLYDKQVVSRGDIDFYGTDYVRTNLGKSLAKPIEKPVSCETWWCGNTIGSIRSKTFVRSTDDCLFDDTGRKTLKSSRWEEWYPTREAVLEALHSRLERDVSNAESALKHAQQALAEFEKQEKKNA